MNKSDALVYAKDVAELISKAETLPGLSGAAKSMADIIEEDFMSIDGVDILTVGVVMSVIGISDTAACMEAYSLDVPMDALKATALMAMAYLYVANSIFNSEGVLKTLEDHFTEGTKEGS